MSDQDSQYVSDTETVLDVYGSFVIDGNEFALSAKAIQEVVNEPSSYSAVPLSPDYLLGLFNLRGLIVPVIDLRKIFNTKEPSDNVADRKVAIIEYGDFCLGLLFDRTGEVFNSREVERSLFSNRSGDIRDVIVEGVFKVEDGNRIIQILDPYELLNLEKIPRSDGYSASYLRQKKVGKRHQCISFNVGDCCCAFDMNSIKEIVEIKAIENTALAHDYTLGAISIRGNTVPVIDFRVFLGKKDQTTLEEITDKGYKVIVMKLGDDLISFLVESIDNIISYFDEDLIQFPAIGASRGEMFRGCLAKDDSQMVLLLDHEEVLTNDELQSITKGHSMLFKDADNIATDQQKAGASRKKTFITFSIDSEFALDIDQVNEVISHPEDIVHPPNMPPAFDGMVNLRGDLIPIINPRSLYSMDRSSSEEVKVLIFTSGDHKYGLAVDSVDSIVTFAEFESTPIPRIGAGGDGMSISEDVKEALMIKTPGAKNRTLLVFDLSSLISKCAPAFAA